MTTLSQRAFKYLQKQENIDYSKGYNSRWANDIVPENQLVYATDTRISTLGRQKTRQGTDFYTVPAGETLDQSQTSATGAADKNISKTAWLAAKFTAGATGRLTKVELELKNIASATGPVIVEIRADNAGTPNSTVLAQSSVPAATPTSTYAYCATRFIEAPLLTSATAYWIVAYIQDDGSNTYAWNSTTSATTSKSSADSGVTWVATSYAMHIKTYLSTDGGVLGRYRAVKSDGTKVTLIAYKEAAGTTAVGTINDITGALTAIKTGLSSSATFYDFEQVGDVVYYVNGIDAPRKWDFTTEAVMGGTPAVSRRIKWHKNHMFLLLAADPAQVIFSDTAAAETFTSTNFIYIPAPKSNDKVVTWGIINDNLVFLTNKLKWALQGSDLSNMVLRRAPGVKGCVSEQGLAVTLTHFYFPSDDGSYAWNGSTDTLLSEHITGDYLAAVNRTNWAGAVYNGRYYLWYTPAGSAQNSACWVFNLTYQSMESNDTGAYVSKGLVFDGAGDTGGFVQASNLVGALYYAEQTSNTYNNLGKKLSWEIRTKYDHFGQPASNKHVKRWYPRFAVAGNYSVSCSYDKDFAGSPTIIPVSLAGTGLIYGTSTTYGTAGLVYGNSTLIDPRITVPGLSKYLQRRYSRTAVNNPVEFEGDTLYYLLRRPR